MPKRLDDTSIAFPPYDSCDEYGVIAIGGDLSPERLLAAYSAGIFPWPHEGLPLLWFFPHPRFVIKPKELKISRSLKKNLRTTNLVIKADTNFFEVIKACQRANRADQRGTWITDELIRGYISLYRMGFAHSIEAYEDNQLVGGLYGISIGSMFFGESMFFLKSNASKICFVTLVAHLISWNFSLIDCQSFTKNFEKFGAIHISAQDFLSALEQAKKTQTRLGPWQLFLSQREVLDLFSKL